MFGVRQPWADFWRIFAPGKWKCPVAASRDPTLPYVIPSLLYSSGSTNVPYLSCQNSMPTRWHPINKNQCSQQELTSFSPIGTVPYSDAIPLRANEMWTSKIPRIYLITSPWFNMTRSPNFPPVPSEICCSHSNVFRYQFLQELCWDRRDLSLRQGLVQMEVKTNGGGLQRSGFSRRSCASFLPWPLGIWMHLVRWLLPLGFLCQKGILAPTWGY